MAIQRINGNDDRKQQIFEDFDTFAKRLNSTFPDRTTTIDQKLRAIDAKKKIMAHPGCPDDTKAALQSEIQTIENEIAEIKKNTSIFGKKSNLG